MPSQICCAPDHDEITLLIILSICGGIGFFVYAVAVLYS